MGIYIALHCLVINSHVQIPMTNTVMTFDLAGVNYTVRVPIFLTGRGIMLLSIP